MAAIFLIPIYLLINFYVLRWTLRWMSACHKYFKGKYFRVVFITIFFLISTTPLTSFLITVNPLHRILKNINNVWFGVFLYAIICIAVADLIRMIMKWTHIYQKRGLDRKRVFIISGTLTIAVILTFSTYGLLHARQLYTTDYQVEIAKDGGKIDNLKVVLVADLHLGYSIGDWHMSNMVKKINAAKPDLVIFAGDIFDNEFGAIKNPENVERILAGIDSTYGSYACYGNHDLDEPILAGFTFKSGDGSYDDSRMQRFFTNAGIELLDDKSLLIDDSFYLIGRKDYSRSKKLEDARLTPAQLTADLDHSKPIFVIDHQPREYQELADAGVDLDLSGHTHNGQIFPGTLTIGLMWENAYGYLQKDEMHTIVTSGVGIWGPNMRVATKSEVVAVDIKFKG